MHTLSEPPNMSYREPRADVTPRRLLQRRHLAAGVCQECTHAPLAWDVDANGEPFQRVLCGECRDRQNAARRVPGSRGGNDAGSLSHAGPARLLPSSATES